MNHRSVLLIDNEKISVVLFGLVLTINGKGTHFTRSPQFTEQDFFRLERNLPSYKASRINFSKCVITDRLLRAIRHAQLDEFSGMNLDSCRVDEDATVLLRRFLQGNIDLRGDGNHELLIANASGTVHLLLNAARNLIYNKTLIGSFWRFSGQSISVHFGSIGGLPVIITSNMLHRLFLVAATAPVELYLSQEDLTKFPDALKGLHYDKMKKINLTNVYWLLTKLNVAKRTYIYNKAGLTCKGYDFVFLSPTSKPNAAVMLLMANLERSRSKNDLFMVTKHSGSSAVKYISTVVFKSWKSIY